MKSLMIVFHLLVLVFTPKVVGMIGNSMPTCLVSVLALLFQPARVFFAYRVGTFLVMFMNFFNQQATKKGGNNQVAAFLYILPCSYSIYTPSDKALYIISCSSVSISAVCMGVTSSNILNPLKSPKMPVFRSLFSPLLALSYHLQ